MKRAGLVGAMVALSLGFAPSAGATAAGAGEPAPRAELRKALDAVGRTGISAIIAEVRDEHGRWRGASGVADLETGRPAPTNGHFRVGSVTKSFVSTVILQLVGEGRLRLTDPIERHLPGLVPGGDRITVRNLLNHTSGLYNYTDGLPLDGDEFVRDRLRYRSPLELVRVATSHEPNFPPGTDWGYSNTNYILAGLIIEKLTGKPYGSEIERRILRPLDLRDTSLPGRSVTVPRPHARGYFVYGEGSAQRRADVTELSPSWAWAAGEIISTTSDLNRFYTALLGGRLLRPAQLAAMKTTVPVADGFAAGLGIFAATLPCGGTVWGHDGGIHGYITQSVHTPDGRRHLTASVNPLDAAGSDEAFAAFYSLAFCGTDSAATPMRLHRVA